MNNKSLQLLFICNGTFVLASSLLGPLYAVFVGKLDQGILTISSSWAAFLLSTTAFMFLMSKLGDRVRKDYLLMGGYLIRALVWLGYIFIGNITQLIFLQILLGLGEALGTPTFQAIFAEHLDKNRHIAEYANWQLVQNIAMALGVLTGGFLANTFGFQILFLTMSVLATISFMGVLFRPKQATLY